MTRMKSLLIPLALMASIPATAQISMREKYGYPVKVTSVYDGDTFTIDGEEWSPFPNLVWKVRIRGIDTPEKRGKCGRERELAKRAHSLTISLLERNDKQRTALILNRRKGYRVWLSAIQHDKYGGRFDAVVTLSDGSSLGDHLINAGVARPYFGGKKRTWCP